MNKKEIKDIAKKVWYFIWESDSTLSWIVNIILAFLIIKFIVYPALGFMLQTSHPIVAVVSGSMEHKTVPAYVEIPFDRNPSDNNIRYSICGNNFESNQKAGFDFFWKYCGNYYENIDITKEQFRTFKFSNGFNTGDIIILRGSKYEDIKVGDIIVYFSPVKSDPIIHRVTKKTYNNSYFFQTKGDHNEISYPFEYSVNEKEIIGKAWIRVPYLGWIKIGFVKLLEVTRIIDLFQWIGGR